jgi:hypothetical protein
MARTKKTTKNDKSNDDQSIQKNIHPNRTGTRWIVLDAVIFLVLLLILSLSMLLISASTKDVDHYYKHYNESDEYLEHSIQALLSSTIDSTYYVDPSGNEVKFGSLSIEDLIVIDLNMRNAETDDINITSLEADFETELFEDLNSILGKHQDFVFVCQYSNSGSGLIKTSSNIYLTNQDNPKGLNKNIEPRFEKQIAIPDFTDNNSLGDEVVIRLYVV